MKGTYRLRPGNGCFWPRSELEVESETPVKAGETIECHDWQLGGHLHRFELLETQAPVEPPRANVGLKAVHRGAGRYDVVDEATGKPINSSSLSKSEAASMVQDAPRPEVDDDVDAGKPNPEAL